MLRALLLIEAAALEGVALALALALVQALLRLVVAQVAAVIAVALIHAPFGAAVSDCIVRRLGLIRPLDLDTAWVVLVAVAPPRPVCGVDPEAAAPADGSVVRVQVLTRMDRAPLAALGLEAVVDNTVADVPAPPLTSV